MGHDLTNVNRWEGDSKKGKQTQGITFSLDFKSCLTEIGQEPRVSEMQIGPTGIIKGKNDSSFTFWCVRYLIKYTAWKPFQYGVFSGSYFRLCSSNTGKYWPEKTQYLDTFHAVMKQTFFSFENKYSG